MLEYKKVVVPFKGLCFTEPSYFAFWRNIAKQLVSTGMVRGERQPLLGLPGWGRGQEPGLLQELSPRCALAAGSPRCLVSREPAEMVSGGGAVHCASGNLACPSLCGVWARVVPRLCVHPRITSLVSSERTAGSHRRPGERLSIPFEKTVLLVTSRPREKAQQRQTFLRRPAPTRPAFQRHSCESAASATGRTCSPRSPRGRERNRRQATQRFWMPAGGGGQASV